jgi:predicted nucleotide-binding protein
VSMPAGPEWVTTQGDEISRPDGQRQATPRDNVVFEAGSFASAKGSDRVLIVLEQGAKLPADLGGAIYAPLADKADIQPIETPVQRFLRAL